MRVRSAGIAALVVPAVLAAPPFARASPARPNPVLVSPVVDYVGPLHGRGGTVATLPALDSAVIAQAVADQAFLTYQRRDDLGGFVPAPLGAFALSSGGRDVVGAGIHQSQIPKFSQAASGVVQSFAFVGTGPTGPPESGKEPVPGLGPPPPVTPPTNTNTTPPPNQGFGGQPSPPTPTTTTSPGTTPTTSPAPPPTTTTPTTTRPPTTTSPPPTTTSPPPTTTVPPPTTTAPTTTSGGPAPPPPPSGCGTVGLSIVSNRAECRIYAVNMAPGGAATERLTITNDSGQPFDLSLRASGTPNALWNDLQMGVWQANSAAPSPLPALLWWTTQENRVTTLQPNQSIVLEIELYLPPTAGNADQGLAAIIDFHWHAEA